MTHQRYIPLLLQLRLVADEQNDARSLVAIAAQFEREAESHLAELAISLRKKAHTRNTIKQRIIALREVDPSLTQQAIAERVGTNPNYVWHVLKDLRIEQSLVRP